MDELCLFTARLDNLRKIKRNEPKVGNKETPLLALGALHTPHEGGRCMEPNPRDVGSSSGWGGGVKHTMS